MASRSCTPDGSARPRPDPARLVTQVGAGGGYYTAILSMLVLPGGKIVAYEIDAALAKAARRNLAPFENASVVHKDAVTAKLPPSDIIYVNAGVVAPPLKWLKALKPGGRLVFPWRPANSIGLAVLATRQPSGFAVRILGGAWFIPCSGASDEAITLKTAEHKRGAAGPVDRPRRRARARRLGGRGLSRPVVFIAGGRPGERRLTIGCTLLRRSSGRLTAVSHAITTRPCITSFWSPSAAP